MLVNSLAVEVRGFRLTDNEKQALQDWARRRATAQASALRSRTRAAATESICPAH